MCLFSLWNVQKKKKKVASKILYRSRTRKISFIIAVVWTETMITTNMAGNAFHEQIPLLSYVKVDLAQTGLPKETIGGRWSAVALLKLFSLEVSQVF